MRRRLPLFLAALTLGAAALVTPSAPAGAAAPRPEFVTGTGDHSPAALATYDATGNQLSAFTANAGNTGARVALGDVDADLQPDIIVGSGPGSPSMVRVFHMDGTLIGSFSPYGAFAGGVNVGVGDIDNGVNSGPSDEIVTAADAGGGPHVIVWDWNATAKTAAPTFSWFAYDPAFRGGVNLSVFDVVNSTRADVITGAGAGGGPHVIVWDLGSGTPTIDGSWLAYDSAFSGGVHVSGGEIDGQRAVLTGAGLGGGPDVRLFSTHGSPRSNFFAYQANFTGGVNVLLSTAQGGDLGHIITAPASNGGPDVEAFTSSGARLWGQIVYGGAMGNGVTLARVPQFGSSNNVSQN